MIAAGLLAVVATVMATGLLAMVASVMTTGLLAMVASGFLAMVATVMTTGFLAMVATVMATWLLAVVATGFLAMVASMMAAAMVAVGLLAVIAAAIPAFPGFLHAFLPCFLHALARFGAFFFRHFAPALSQVGGTIILGRSFVVIRGSGNSKERQDASYEACADNSIEPVCFLHVFILVLP